MPDTSRPTPAEPSYIEQIERMTSKMSQLSEKLNFTMVSAVEKESDQGAQDTSLRTALTELESRIDDLLERTRY
jgi:hypothetical protein